MKKKCTDGTEVKRTCAFNLQGFYNQQIKPENQ